MQNLAWFYESVLKHEYMPQESGDANNNCCPIMKELDDVKRELEDITKRKREEGEELQRKRQKLDKKVAKLVAGRKALRQAKEEFTKEKEAACKELLIKMQECVAAGRSRWVWKTGAIVLCLVLTTAGCPNNPVCHGV